VIIDKSIPYFNILMRCAAYTPAPIRLPAGYRFRDYRDGDAMEWAWVEHQIQDFDTFEEAYRYFRDTYDGELEALRQRFICVVNEKGEFAGCVTAWREKSGDVLIPAVHWLAVSPKEQGRGIGHALMRKLLERFLELDGFPIYLHSQPCSYVAVGLYSSLGFRVLKQESIMGYENQFEESMAVLKTLMPPEKFQKLMDEAIG
jgi:ribosomal protein S18 acetylase RimI-like enzyme